MEINPFSDDYFMKEALKEAYKALDKDEVPVGCVVVCENKIIARSVNEEKNNLALKIIPELISSDARLGISGSFIELNQLFEKKNTVEKPNKIKILKVHKYR